MTTYLSLSATVALSDNSNINQANSLTKQVLSISPGVAMQAGQAWSDSVAPSTRTTVVDTKRSLAYDATTQFQVLLPRALETDTWRLRHTGTGTAPAFRTKRTIGLDATSDVSITVLSSTIARISTVAGTVLTTTNVVVGDQLLFERTTDSFTSVFADTNTGTVFTVSGKGSGYVDVVHNGVLTAEHVVLGSGFADQVRIFSAGPVKVGDIVEIVDTFNYGNRKKVVASMVRDDYIEFTASDMTPETLIGCTAGTSLKIYDRLIKSFSIQADSDIWVYFDGAGVKMSPVGLTSQGFLTVACTKLEVENTGENSVSAAILYATATGSC